MYASDFLQNGMPAITGDPSVFTNNGGIFACQSKARFEVQRRVSNMASQNFGIENHLLSPEEAKKVQPYMNVDDCYG